MSERIDLDAVKRRAEGDEIADVMRDGEEIVFCDDFGGEYVGWTTRENAIARGYIVSRTQPDPVVLALVEAVEAAQLVVAEHWFQVRSEGPAHILAAAVDRFGADT